MREIAAITFTEAAASELRARIREAFERLVHDDATPDRPARAGRGGAGRSRRRRHRHRAQLRPADPGRAPGGGGAAAARRGARRGREPARVRAPVGGARRPDVRRRATRRGDRASRAGSGSGSTTGKFASLRDVAVVFSDNWDRVDRGRGGDGSTCRRSTAARRSAALAAFAPVLDQCRGDPRRQARRAIWLERGAGAPPALADALATRRTPRCSAAIPAGLEARPRRHRAGRRPGAARTGRRGARELAHGGRARGRARSRTRSPTRCCSVLAGEVARFTLRRRDERRREGRLEFHDLLVLARTSAPGQRRRPRRAARAGTAAPDRRVPGHRPDPDRAGDADRGVGRWRARSRTDGRTSSSTRAPLLRRRPEAVDLPVPAGRHRAVPRRPRPVHRPRRCGSPPTSARCRPSSRG